MSTHELEERLSALESRIAFQDLTIDELNTVVTRQQTEIADIAQRLRELLEQAAAASVNKDIDSKPPHY